MGEATKKLLYACLAIVGFLITIIVFFLYGLVSRAKRQSVYSMSVKESTAHQPVQNVEHFVQEESTRAEQEPTVENQENDHIDVDDKDTDSLTRNLSFRNFERPERFTPERFTPEPDNERESVENTVTIVQTENLEQSVVAEEQKDDDEGSDTDMHRGLSFTGFEKLIERAITRKIVYTDAQEATEDQGNGGNESTSYKTEDVDSTTGSKRVSGDLETIGENDTGFLNILNTESSTDEMTEAYGLSLGILGNYHQREPANSGHDEISGSLKNKDSSEILEHGKSNNNNDDISTISSSSCDGRREKQVTFSDSTYIVESRIHETSNFEFVKFVRQQQKKT